MHTRELPLTNRQSQTTIGVLTERELVLHHKFAQGKYQLRSLLLPPDAADPGELLGFLWQAELSVVWVMPGTRWSQTLTRAWFQLLQSQWAVIVRSDSQEPDRPLSVLVWPKGNQQPIARQLVFAFPEQAGWGWQLSDATSLLATVTYLERVLARPVSDGLPLLAQQLLTEQTAHASSSSWPCSSPTERVCDEESATAPIFSEQQIRPLAWMRPLMRAEQRQKYLHQYSHLSYHLEACLRVPLPAGTCAYSSNGRAYDGSRPGLWRVLAERAGSVFDGTQLPSCLDGEWMSTSQVQCCHNIGYRVQVQEGFFWSQSQQSLQPWAQALWQAAERTYVPSPLFKHEQGRANTFSSIALLAQLGLAHLSREPRESGFGAQWWPYIVGGSRATLFAHLVHFVRRGVMPILINGDALWVVSDDPHPLTAAPGLLNTRRWNGYRVGYTVPLLLSRDVQQIFSTVRSPEQAALLLDALANEIPRT